MSDTIALFAVLIVVLPAAAIGCWIGMLQERPPTSRHSETASAAALDVRSERSNRQTPEGRLRA